MKCSACSLKHCERKYENSEKCLGIKEQIKCICICQTPPLKSTVISIGTATVGVAVAAAGVTLTVLSGGVFAVAAGTAVLIGVGSTLVFAPIQKQITGESITAKHLARDVALGAAIGAITGPIGAGGALLAEGTSALASFGIRAFAGTTAGIVSAAVQETSKLFKGERITKKSVGKSLALGAIVGTVGGASAQAAYQASSQVTQEVGRAVGAVTRIGVQGATAAATDASLQYCQNKKVNLQQLGLHTMGQIIVSGTAELTSTIAKGADNHNNRVSVVKSKGVSGTRISVKFENADIPSEELELILEEARPEDFIDQETLERHPRHIEEDYDMDSKEPAASHSNSDPVIIERSDNQDVVQNSSVDIDNATPVVDPKIVDRTMKMCIIPSTYPIDIFQKTHILSIQQHFTRTVNRLDENNSTLPAETPDFRRQKFKDGCWQVTCMNQFTRDWLTHVVSDWIIDGMTVKAITVDELQQMMTYEFWIEGSLLQQRMVLNRIRKQNKGLKTNKWQLKRLDEDLVGTRVAYQLDIESIRMIKDKDFRLCNVLWNEEK